MSDALTGVLRDWSFTQLAQADQVRDQFEQRWQSPSRLAIEELLSTHASLPRPLLLQELLQSEWTLRRGRGDSLTLADYLRRFPHDAAVVECAWRQFSALSPPAKDADLTAPFEPSDEDTAPNDTPPGSAVTRFPDNHQLGHYTLLRMLGCGSFGTVYLAHDAGRNRQVAVKLLHPDLLTSERRRLAFEQEAGVGQQLDHPHLVQTLGIERHEDQLFIVQEYIDGSDLAHWCRDHACSPEQIARLLIPVARALACLHAHQRHFVHRDLKPSNILVDRHGRPYVTDFGLALREDDQRQRRGEFAGTRAYMSPEQVRGQTELIDGRSDLWSLGVIFYQLLTDRLPFGGPPPRRSTDDWHAWYRDLQYEIQEHDPRPPRHIRPDISRRLEQICLRCLEKRQRDRYQTGHDLAEDLALYLERSEPSESPAARRTSRRMVPRGLRSFDQADADFFLELLPGPRTSEGIPASVAFWQQRLAGAGAIRPLEIGVLYGPSGSGKSSLVKAGLLPRLGDDCQVVLVEASAGDTLGRLRKALKRALPELPDGMSWGETGRWLVTAGLPAGRRLLLVLDQFEQWMHANPDPARSELIELLRYCNGSRLQALLLARDDFWMPLARVLDALELSLQDGQNAAAVDRFDQDHARQVLAAFGRAYGRLPDDDAQWTAEQREFLDAAVADLAEEGRVVCVRLAVFAEMFKDRSWVPAELLAVGGARGVGVTLLEEKLGRRAPVAYRPHGAAARRVLERFLPASGSQLKGQYQTADELRLAAGYSSDADFQRLLGILDGELKLLTPCAPDNSPDSEPAREAGQLPQALSDDPHAQDASQTSQPPAQAWQLTHDFLVPALREWLTSDLRRSRRGRALLKLRERSEDWNRRPEPRRLPSPVEWLSIWWLVPRQMRSAAEQRMMRQATGRLARRLLLWSTTLAVLAIALWVATNRWRARDYHRRLVGGRISEVPELAAELPAIRFWTRQLLERSYARQLPPPGTLLPPDSDQLQRLLNLSLVLGQTDPAKLGPLWDHLAHLPAEDLAVVAQLLQDDSPGLAGELRRLVERSAASRSSDLLPQAALLAAVAPGDDSLRTAAPLLARQLGSTRPTAFPDWLRLLQPAADPLRPAALEWWSSGSVLRGSQRGQLAECLALYGADDAQTLVQSLRDAEPEEYALFLPPLLELGEAGQRAIRHELDQLRHAALWPRRPHDTPAPSDNLATRLETCQGRLSRFSGLALAVPRGDLIQFCQQLAAEGYRPVAVRPHGAGLASVAWTRDQVGYRLELDQPAARFEAALAAHAGDGYHLCDLALALPVPGTDPGEPVWSGVWRQSVESDPAVEVLFDIDSTQHEARKDRLAKEGFCLLSSVTRVAADGQRRDSSIWSKLNRSEAEQEALQVYAEESIGFTRVRAVDDFGDIYPGYFQTDLQVEVRAAAEPAPGDAPRVAPRDAPGESATERAPPQVLLRGVWQGGTRCAAVSQLHLNETARQLLEAFDLRTRRGFQPAIVQLVPGDESAPPQFASVWRRAEGEPAESARTARRIASLIVVLAHCGQPGELFELFGQQADDRDPRSLAIELLARSRFDVRTLAAEAANTSSDLARYSLLLALGNYPADAVMPADRQRVAQWAASHPAAAVRSAAQWCARQWKLPVEAARAADGRERPTRGDNWYVNEEGQSMIVLGPARFRMGTSELERERDSSEQQTWTSIPRRYALAATHVTVAEYRRFLAAPEVKSRLPAKVHELLTHNRAALNQTMWHPACPQTGLTRLQAMLYCEWLSERAGIPVEQRCYPDIWQYVQQSEQADSQATAADLKYGYRPSGDVLARSGYRLPTEAELEYALRAGSGESRFFGDSHDLLDAYVWYRENSGGKSHPVGLKKPNPYGLFDCLGNVQQYGLDLYLAYRAPAAGDTRPDAPNLFQQAPGTYVQRGGDFDSPPRQVRSADRSLASHTNNRFTHGFRVARTQP